MPDFIELKALLAGSNQFCVPSPFTVNTFAVFALFRTRSAMSVLNAPCALTSSLTLVDGVAPSPSRLFVLSQNKVLSCCKTLPVPSNNMPPTVPEAIGVVPIVKPEPLKMFAPVKDFVS